MVLVWICGTSVKEWDPVVGYIILSLEQEGFKRLRAIFLGP